MNAIPIRRRRLIQGVISNSLFGSIYCNDGNLNISLAFCDGTKAYSCREHVDRGEEHPWQRHINFVDKTEPSVKHHLASRQTATLLVRAQRVPPLYFQSLN